VRLVNVRLEPLAVVEPVLVDGAMCGRMHFNPPDAMVCRQCGASMTGTRNIRRQPRPPLGVLLVDDGQRSVEFLPYRVSATPDGATT
jgi:ribosomal protein L40E